MKRASFLKTAIRNEILDFFRNYNVVGIVLLFSMFMIGVSIIIAGWYIAPEHAQVADQTKIEFEGHTFITPGNILQAVGVIASIVPLLAIYRIAITKK